MPDSTPKSSSDEILQDETKTDIKKPANGSKQSEGKAVEIGGRKGLDPVRYGDWEKGGRCIDF
ncbi:MAG: DUF1674 domain-containing protein [Gammaproteobacteria bacterium]